MRQHAIALACLVSLVPAARAGSQGVQVRVDPGVELIAIVNRLAGREEYNLTRATRWATAVDEHFSQYREHPAVQMTQRLRFGFFIPMNLAAHLTAPPELVERSPFESSTSLHRRWTTFPDSTRRYVELLRSFSQDTRFAEFLSTQRGQVDAARSELEAAAARIDREWIQRFWGAPAGSDFVLVAGLTNGSANYGQVFVPASGRSEAWAIIGVTKVDERGQPLFDSTHVPTILHEMMHPWVTPLVDAHRADFAAFGDSLYARVAGQMRNQFYGDWESMITETLVRASVPHYYLAHGDSARAERIIVEEIALGFLWTRELVTLLGEYERNRAAYPSMANLMPRIVALLRGWPLGG